MSDIERAKDILMQQYDIIGDIGLTYVLHFIDNQATILKEAENIIWQLTDESETSDKDNLHKCHYCKETSWGEIDHKPNCIVKKAEDFYYKESIG